MACFLNACFKSSADASRPTPRIAVTKKKRRKKKKNKKTKMGEFPKQHKRHKWITRGQQHESATNVSTFDLTVKVASLGRATTTSFTSSSSRILSVHFGFNLRVKPQTLLKKIFGSNGRKLGF
jgi:hypothetical protein